MKITILQTDIKWNDIKANISNAERLIKDAPHSDLYVLPEMWSTGFATEPKDISEDVSSCTSLQWMIDTAISFKCAMAGSLSVCESGRFRNRLYFVYPDGTYDYYDKHHLFRLGGEDKFYTAGNKKVIIEYQGVRIRLVTCFDLRFPEWIRNFNDYDCMLVVANWPESRQNAWNILLKARAIENQCFVIGVNRIGDDQHCHYIGESEVIDAYGYPLLSSPNSENTANTCEIDMEQLLHFRDKFNILKDRDNYQLV